MSLTDKGEHKIYLGGPDVFLADAREVGRRKAQMCGALSEAGGLKFVGLFPLDNKLEGAGDAGKIFRANCALMREASIGLFNLTPFRGPSADPGTVFELGFMFSQNKKVYGYTSDDRVYLKRVAAAIGAGDAGDGPRDRANFKIEDYGLCDNLMIVQAIEEAGGEVCAVAERRSGENGPSLAAFAAFEACLKIVRQRTLLLDHESRQSHKSRSTDRSLSALAMTLTEDNDIASAAMTGESRMPVNG